MLGRRECVLRVQYDTWLAYLAYQEGLFGGGFWITVWVWLGIGRDGSTSTVQYRTSALQAQ